MMKYNQLVNKESTSDGTARLNKIRKFAGLVSLVAAMSAIGAEKIDSAPVPGKIVVYPSAQSIPAKGKLPPGASASITMNTAIGGHDGAWVVVKNAKNISAIINESESNSNPSLELDIGQYVKFGNELVPDALVPWDGTSKDTEQPNQPIYVEVEAPYGTAPGKYNETVTISADGLENDIPITVNVYNTILPKPNKANSDNPIAIFNVSPQAYVNKTAEIFNYESNEERQVAYNSLFKFLADYRISPTNWGFGEPRTTAGYTQSNKWWVDSSQNMINAVGDGESKFPALRIPISSNRTTANNYIAGLNPAEPEKWCGYLQNVHSFWDKQGWLKGTLPYLYGQDEPDLFGQKLVERQAESVHKCFPGSKVLMTGNPSPNGATDFLLDDVDIWTILASREYGKMNAANGINRSVENVAAIDKIKKLNKLSWSYNYNVPGTPGYTADQPLSNPRMFMLWNALQQKTGTLYAQNMTKYNEDSNPLKNVEENGEFVLIYPGENGPIASARLEQIRYGMEDWALLNIVSKKAGATAVRGILGSSGLFSVNAKGAVLACVSGCELKSDTKFSWPLWSEDGTTAQKIADARVQALKVASKK